MITKENLRKIYLKNINGELIEAKELKDYNLNYNDITKLIEQGVIKRIENGIYITEAYSV